MKPTPDGWPRISQAVFYPDAATAIDWLRDAFGFAVERVVRDDAGRIKNSELTLPGGKLLVADTDRARGQAIDRAPEQVDGCNTQNLFVYVDDVEAHLARARAAGARITKEPTVSDYGDDYWADIGYECFDAGGHRWWFAQRTHTGAGYQPKLDAGDTATATPKGWPRISSTLHYAEAARAIDWLCRAFGFVVQLKVEGDGGAIHHSELVLGGGLVMVEDVARAPERWPNHREPNQIGGANTQSLQVYIDDAVALCEQARAAGATIVREPRLSDHGEGYWADLSFEAIDPGGHRWWFSERKRS